MNPHNSIQLVGTELVIVADAVTQNQVSVKPDRDIPTRLWGSINGVLNYSVPVGAVSKIIVYMDPTDKLWVDSRVSVPVLRFAFDASLKKSSANKRAVRIDYLRDGEYITSATEENGWKVALGSISGDVKDHLKAVTVYEDGSQQEETIISVPKLSYFGSPSLPLLSAEESLLL